MYFRSMTGKRFLTSLFLLVLLLHVHRSTAQGGCDAPTAVFTGNAGDTARVCIGTTITFDGSASMAAPGGTIGLWIWSDGETTDTTTTPVTEWTFPEGGYYPMHLVVVDVEGCASAPSQTLPVLVSLTPNFSDHLVPLAACVDVEIPLSVDPVMPPMMPAAGAGWTETAPAWLPDDVGRVNSFPAIWTTADPNATITDPTQLGDICLDIEHSSIGDIIIELTCPSGDSVLLHQQGGGTITYLGMAYEGPGDTLPGSCGTYCFNAQPEFGTWVACASSGFTPNVTALPDGVFMLNPGTYTTASSLDDLVGCPVNGTWTLTITDFWAADDGYLCSWSIGANGDDNFVPYGPTLGTQDPDSSSWSGTNVINNMAAPTTATATSPSAGYIPYTYAVLDSYGCTYDTTMTVHVAGPFTADAGPDVSYCTGGAVVLGGSVTTPDGPLGCEYTLILRDQVGNGWGSALVRISLDGVHTNYTLPNGQVERVIPISMVGASELVVRYQPALNDDQNGYLLLDSNGDTLVMDLSDPTSGVVYSGAVPCSIHGSSVQWTPGADLVYPSTFTPTTNVAGTYTMTYTVAGPAGCSASDDVTVGTYTLPPMELVYDSDAGTLCAESGFVSYVWTNVELGSTTTTTVPCRPIVNTVNGWAYTATAFDANGCIAFSDSAFQCPTVQFYDFGTALYTNYGFSDYAWTFNGEPIPGADGYSVPYQGYGTYGVSFTNAVGCLVEGEYVYTNTGTDALVATTPALHIRPVPNNGTFQVALDGSFSGTGELRVLDMAGRIVHQRTLLAQQRGATIQLALDLVAGTYTVEVVTGSGMLRQRIIVAR